MRGGGREGYGKGREERGGERKGRNGKGTHSGLDPVPLLFFADLHAHGKVHRENLHSRRTFVPLA